MKKMIILAVTALAALSFVSCSKESAPEQVSAAPFTVNITVGDPHGGTRDVKSGWENGDVINCWFDTNRSKEPDMTLTYRDGNWISSEVRQEIAQNLKEEGQLKFFWEGSNSWSTWQLAYGNFLPYSFKPANGKGYPLVLHESENPTDNVYHFDGASNTLSANLKWTFGTNVQVVVEGIKPEDGYKLVCDGGGLYMLNDITVSSTYTSLGNGNVAQLGVANGENATAFSLFATQTGENTFNFTLTAPNKQKTYYSVTKTIDYPSTELKLHLVAARIPKVRFYSGMVQDHPYVDMGEGHKWAVTNLGADKAEAVCDYYCWDETSPHYVTLDPLVWKDDFSYGYDMGPYEYNKYNSTDGKMALDPEDDAATVNWGDSWRIPSSDEWQWLLDNCTWTWVTLNGVTGRLVTSNLTGNSIFLRAAGCFRGYRGSTDQQSSECQYWSSTRNTSYMFAMMLNDYPGRGNADPIIMMPRAYGLPVRPVTD